MALNVGDIVYYTEQWIRCQVQIIADKSDEDWHYFDLKILKDEAGTLDPKDIGTIMSAQRAKASAYSGMWFLRPSLRGTPFF